MIMSVDLSKGILVFPPSLFLFTFLFLSVFYFVCGLISSLGYFVYPLWESFVCPLWDFFLTLGAILYFTSGIEGIHTLQEVFNLKRMKTIMMYADVCLC